MSWTIYAARGFVNKRGEFDPAQINDGLDLGFYPAIVTISKANNKKAINDTCKYLKEKEIYGIPMKITSHGRGEFIDSRMPEVKDSIDLVIKLNERYGKKIIREIDFHFGALHTFGEEYDIRKKALEEGVIYDNIAATYTAEEYYSAKKNAEGNLNKIKKHAQKYGIEIWIENVSINNFATRDYLPLLNKMGRKPEYTEEDLNKDKRFRDTKWIPEELHLGDFGFLIDQKSSGICLDIEHFGITVEHSKVYNFETMGRPKMDKWQEKVFNECGIYIEKGKPVLFEKEIDPIKTIEELGDNIEICHLMGYQGNGMFYYDIIDGRKVKKISTHMPILFEGDRDPLKIVEDDNVRTDLARKTEKTLKSYLKVLNKTGCRKAMTEIHIGSIYTGPIWKEYHKTSLRNIKSILNSL